MVGENLMLLEYIKLLRPRFNAYWCETLCVRLLLVKYPEFRATAHRYKLCSYCHKPSILWGRTR